MQEEGNLKKVIFNILRVTWRIIKQEQEIQYRSAAKWIRGMVANGKWESESDNCAPGMEGNLYRLKQVRMF